MLLTLSPLGSNPNQFYASIKLQWATSYDLHVLGMPPAFILSQDQTLQKNLFFVCLFLFPDFKGFDVLLSFQRSCNLFSSCLFNISNLTSDVNTFFEKSFLFFLGWQSFLTWISSCLSNITPTFHKVNTFFNFFTKKVTYA